MARRLGSFLVALISALVASELILRSQYPLDQRLFGLDPELLYAPIPDARNLLRMPDGRMVLTELNSRGHRGNELESPKEGIRIAVFGDSLVMAENVPLHQTFAERLGGLASAARERPVEVVNAGVTGYGPDQVLMKMRREVRGLDADVLIVVLCAANDFGDLLHNKLFRLTPDGVEVNSPVLDDSIRARFAESEERAERFALTRAYDAWRQPPAVPAAPYDYIGEYLRGAELEYREWIDAKSERVVFLMQDYYDADIAIRPESLSAQLKIGLMYGVLGEMRELAAEHELPLLAVVVPCAVDVDPTFGIRVDPVVHPTYDPGRLTGQLMVLLEALGVEALDLTRDFAEGKGPLFEGGEDFHWNAAGQMLSARRTLEELLERGLLPD